MKVKVKTSRKLGKSHSFWASFATALDIFGSFSPRITVADLENGPQKDSIALRGDWQRVGTDIRTAMDKVQYEFQGQ